MKKKIIVLLFSIAIIISGCFNEELKNDSPNEESAAVNDAVTSTTATVTPVNVSAGLAEGFETGNFTKYSWTKGGTVAPVVQSSIKYEGTYAAQFNSRNLYSGQNSYLELVVTNTAASVLSFYLKTDIGTNVSTAFVFYLDGVKQNQWNGLNGTWNSVSVNLTSGQHKLRWVVEKNSNSYYPSSQNSVYLDKVSIASDKIAKLEIAPNAPQKALINSTILKYGVIGKRADGSVKAGVTATYSVVAGTGSGTIDASGNFKGTKAGLCTVKAVSNGITVNSAQIEVLPANYLDLPFVYNGVTYSGSTNAGSGNPINYADANIKVTSPTVKTISADGFFVLKGNVAYTAAYQYALVKVTKGTESTSYWVRGNFAKRIWLRFGTGAYTVTVHKAQITSQNLNYEGDINGWTYWSPLYTFNVTNTRNEDGKFYYPSDPIQSDDLTIYNKAMELTNSLTSQGDKIKALHDYVVTYLYYDKASLTANQRKKQDALTVLANKTGVCEGYTSLYNSLLRVTGIKAKAIGGLGNGGSHAWSNVLLGSTWYFVDTTWDDPLPYDTNPQSIFYTYYMLTNMTGVNGDHQPQTERVERGPVEVASTWAGYPDGVY